MSKKIFWILSFMVGVSCANTPSVGHYNYQGSPEQRFPYENYKPHHHHNNNPGYNTYPIYPSYGYGNPVFIYPGQIVFPSQMNLGYGNRKY